MTNPPIPITVSELKLERVARVLCERSIRRRSHWQDGDQKLIKIAVGQNWQGFKADAQAAIEALGASIEDEVRELPCDVKLPPATIIRAGCKLSTLIHELELHGMTAPNHRDTEHE